MKKWKAPSLIIRCSTSTVKAKWLLGAALLVLAACQINKVECDTVCAENWLDGAKVNDSCDTAKSCRVSTSLGRPVSHDDSIRPVILAVHGFTASTYEWEEFK